MSQATFTSPLPRYRTLTIAIRMALYGRANGLVQHMAQRNRDIDDMRQLEQVMAKGKARA